MWTFENIPDQTGRTALVTGANTGIGFETARLLAQRGARVVLACRSQPKGSEAVARIEAEAPAAKAELLLLDLASLASVRRAADELMERTDRLDLLIHNAGVMVPPEGKTEDGFELQIGVNFLGPFALTGHLLGRVMDTPGSRVVTVSSLAHRRGRIDFASFRGPRRYHAWRAYQQSKLADLMFALELSRRLSAKGSSTLSTAAHPGATKTALQRHSSFLDVGASVFGMDAPKGALPTLYAATAREAEPGGYYGPGGLYELRGYPSPARIDRRARDEAMARQLWAEAEALTHVSFLGD